MSKSGKIGKRHVLGVTEALKKSIEGTSIDVYSETVQETVKFIREEYSNIDRVIGKYDTDLPDQHPDICLILSKGETVNINLFTIKGKAAIQPKNLGAKSFLEKYFCSKGLQMYFTDYLNKEYDNFLRNLIDTMEPNDPYDKTLTLRRKVKKYYPSFTDDVNCYRKEFLFLIREYCFELIKNEYNLGGSGIKHAFSELLMIGDKTIITRYTDGNKCLFVEEWKSKIDQSSDVHIYKKGNDTLGLRSGGEALTLRFKFESGPASSIKIATSYDRFPESEIIKDKNNQSTQKFEQVISQHIKMKDEKSNQNAIGRCNEAMIYYRILKEYPFVLQTNEDEYLFMFRKYSEKVSTSKIEKIQRASTITVRKIIQYLDEKYSQYEISSIQLVGDSYLKDRLDTSDLQLIIFVDGKYIIESLSLKAVEKKSVKITAKNPGSGTILGPQYFNVGSLVPTLEQVKVEFDKGFIKHEDVLEKISLKIGESLSCAPQENLKTGLKALLGSNTMIITFYGENDSLVIEYDEIEGKVDVFPSFPSKKQTTLKWNYNREEISLRVKFSRGQKYGWSTIKLSCDYKINYV